MLEQIRLTLLNSRSPYFYDTLNFIKLFSIGDRNDFKWGVLNYLGHKRVADNTEFAVSVSRDLTTLANQIEVGLRYQPHDNFVYRTKVITIQNIIRQITLFLILIQINDDLLMTSGFALRINKLITAVIACQVN